MHHLDSVGLNARTPLSLIRMALLALAVLFAQGAYAQRVWGINGHPDNVEYLVWENPEAARQQFDHLNELGCSHYRVSFSESLDDPRILDHLVPLSQQRAQKIQIVPVIFTAVKPSAGFQKNYDAGYAQGRKWATYALDRGYVITHWELGNETSLASIDGKRLFALRKDAVGKDLDPTHPANWIDSADFPGATQAMAGVLRGLYWGVKDTYSARNASTKILFGDLWIHFGYVRKLMAVGGANFLPADILSWHWYTPSFGSFTQPLKGNNPATAPASYAASFGKDIWMTEVGREIKVAVSPTEWAPVGGSADNPYNGNENWASQSSELMSQLNNLVTVPQIKGIFVYQLFDENRSFVNASTAQKSSQAFHGLFNADGYRKTAFYTYRDFIRAHRW
jgi:hypothetical protein